MNMRTKLIVVLPSLVLALAGCQGPQHRPSGVAFQEQTITIDELATRLGLRIEQRDPAFVVMKDAANTVIVFTQTDGRFFINGRPIGPVGNVERIGHTIRVPETLVGAIRSHVQPGAGERPPVTAPRRQTAAVVVVDAGHGGKDPGTMVAATPEKVINLQVARTVAALLQQRGVTVVMTRRDDRYPELEDRADLANRRGADLFVSIHCDSSPDPGITGFTLYIAPDASPQARKAAQSISTAMARTGSGTRGIRHAEYKVLVLTRCPAVLVELGYLSNPVEARRLQDPAHQARLANALAEGILAALQ